MEVGDIIKLDCGLSNVQELKVTKVIDKYTIAAKTCYHYKMFFSNQVSFGEEKIYSLKDKIYWKV